MSFAGESEFGVGLMLGLGWDIRVGRNVSLTPFWNGFAMSKFQRGRQRRSDRPGLHGPLRLAAGNDQA